MRPLQTHEPPCERVDSRFLQDLLGYNTRRYTLALFEVFAARTEPYGLKPVEFSVLHLIGRNPNVSPSQLCAELALLPPNLTKILQKLARNRLVQKFRPVSDGRAVYLKLTDDGKVQLEAMEKSIVRLERDFAAELSDQEFKQLLNLLQRIMKRPRAE